MSQAAQNFQCFRLHKRGNSALEYEDASAAATGSNFAIADGATDSSYASLWAQLLVEEFVRAPAPAPNDWREWLPPLQKRWDSQVGQLELPWYGEAKLKQGAFAAFLGLVIDPPNWWGRRRWRAVAVGDCCLFHVRQQALCAGFPIARASEFNNQPGLVGSRTPPAVLLDKNRIQTSNGSWQVGDQLWLMTDALAKWFLQQQEADKTPCAAIELMLTEASTENFTTWIEELRSANELRNDDVTLLAVKL